MAFLLLASSVASALAQTPTETAPIIINQGPTARCYGWYAEPTINGIPPTTETSCAGSNMYGRFTLADYDWKYPSEYGTSPGFSGSVNGSNGSPLTVSLTNSAKNADCNDALEVNLSFDYPGSALYSNISTLDLTQYDTVIIEYDIYIQSVTSSKSDCACYSGVGPCPFWWKSQFTTDILFYQGTNPQDFNAISVRHFDPQNFGVNTWNVAGGHRVQYTDHQVPSQSGARAHVKLDAKYLFRQYSNQLCQGGGLRGPIYMRSIQLVMLNTGTDMTVQLSNVQANAFKYAPGQFTPSAVTPGPTGTNCPAATSSSTSTSSAPGPTTSKYGQCGGINYTGPTQCPPDTTCQYQNDYYSQCL